MELFIVNGAVAESLMKIAEATQNLKMTVPHVAGSLGANLKCPCDSHFASGYFLTHMSQQAESSREDVPVPRVPAFREAPNMAHA